MKIHIVQKGDTLWKIAQKYNVDLQTLIEANPQIKNPDRIDIGMKIIIPIGGTPMEPKYPKEMPKPLYNNHYHKDQ
ncbi:SafA/ExsA family spore coat assembly protein [Tepidibacillus marianensis]|uniref:SafA/ExsA family spore coat assembly protein n=1 Tax=Tepidibacillus marianensis TaxID=3131995 RepID=UPI0030CEA373